MPEALPNALATQDFSLLALFLRADLIVQIVMGILALSSVWSWAVAIDKWFSVSGARARAKRFEQAFWAGQPLDDINERVTEKPAEAMAPLTMICTMVPRITTREPTPVMVRVAVSMMPSAVS